MKYTILLLWLFVLGALAACRKPANIDLDNEKTMPVISCLYAAGDLFRVKVGYTRRGGEAPKWEAAAQLTLYEDGNVRGGFTYNGAGEYVSNLVAKVGSRYKLVVDIPGYGQVYAEDECPNFPSLGDCAFRDEGNRLQSGSENYPAFNYYNIIKDSKPSIDYYEAYLLYYNSSAQDTFYQQHYLMDFSTNAPMQAERDLSYYKYQGYVFSDRLFQGQDYSFVYLAGTHNPATTNAFFRLQGVSQNYYLYRKSWLTHAFNQALSADISGDFFGFIQLGEPVELYTNMEGKEALGVFAGYAPVIKICRQL